MPFCTRSPNRILFSREPYENLEMVIWFSFKWTSMGCLMPSISKCSMIWGMLIFVGIQFSDRREYLQICGSSELKRAFFFIFCFYSKWRRRNFKAIKRRRSGIGWLRYPWKLTLIRERINNTLKRTRLSNNTHLQIPIFRLVKRNQNSKSNH